MIKSRLVPLKELLQDARSGGYALPAFNIWTYQDALALLEAANIACAPIIIQVSGTSVAHNTLELAYHMAKTAIDHHATTPVALHLDHAKDIGLISHALNLGFSSIMYDGSELSTDENLARTQFARELTHAYGASLEGEIGHVVKGEGDKEISTTPEEALFFAKETGVDALAVAVGTRHGMQTQDAPTQHDSCQSPV